MWRTVIDLRYCSTACGCISAGEDYRGSGSREHQRCLKSKTTGAGDNDNAILF
jgi:hypothetical protein